MSAQTILSDEFLEFQTTTLTKLNELNKAKKDANAKFKQVYDEHKGYVADLEDQAADLMAKLKQRLDEQQETK